MDLILDWLSDKIWGLYTAGLETIVGMIDIKTISEMAKLSPSQFMGGTLWKFVQEVSANFMSVIGWSLLALFLLLAIADVLKRQDVRGVDGMFMIGMVFLKILVAKLLMDNATTIIDAVFGIVGSLVNAVSNTTLGKGSGVISNKAIEGLIAKLEERSNEDSSALIAFILMFIPVIFSFILSVFAKVIIYLRFMEITVFSAVAPLAIATWPSEEWNVIFKNWLKRLIAVAFHAVLIVFILAMYGPMVEWAISKGIDTGGVKQSLAPIMVMFQLVGYQIVLVMALFQTGGWARSLLNAS